MSANDFFEDRRNLTFEQAEGIEPLPTQLQLKEVSPELSARLFALIHSEFQRHSMYVDSGISGFYAIQAPWSNILYRYHVERRWKSSDEFSNKLEDNINLIKQMVYHGTYDQIFGFFWFAIRTKQLEYRFAMSLQKALSDFRAAYRVLDDDTIVPMASEIEGRTIQRALDTLASAGLGGARAHLKAAGQQVTIGEYADSIRESITAVESVARGITDSGKLSDALAKLDTRAEIQ